MLRCSECFESQLSCGLCILSSCLAFEVAKVLCMFPSITTFLCSFLNSTVHTVIFFTYLYSAAEAWQVVLLHRTHVSFFSSFYFLSALGALQTTPEGLDCCQNAECYFHISIPHRKGSWETPLSPSVSWCGLAQKHFTCHYSSWFQRVYLFSINHTHTDL